MGKRGPAPKGDYSDKTEVFSTRIRPDLKQRLQTAAAENGRSVSQEVERRLRRSFDDDLVAVETFGSRRNRALMKMIAQSIETVWSPETPDADWLSDPWSFEQVVQTVNRVLEAARPQGRIPVVREAELRELFAGKPAKVAARLWRGIHEADASKIPVLTTSQQGRLLNLLKGDLRRRRRARCRSDRSDKVHPAKEGNERRSHPPARPRFVGVEIRRAARSDHWPPRGQVQNGARIETRCAARVAQAGRRGRERHARRCRQADARCVADVVDGRSPPRPQRQDGRTIWRAHRQAHRAEIGQRCSAK